MEMFKYSVLKYIGSYAAVMNGVDLIVFTGGIGENDPSVRQYIGERISYLGAEFNQSANDGLRGKDAILTKEGSKVVIAAITTNEELVIARDTMKLAK